MKSDSAKTERCDNMSDNKMNNMASIKKKILIAEDDRALGNGVALALQDEKTEIVLTDTLSAAKTSLAANKFDLLILDINLPDGSGLDLLKFVKEKHGVPVILLTANDLETDVVNGLEMGADDYITKPFSLAILRARVKNQLRRNAGKKSGLYETDCFLFDFEAMKFSKNGACLELSKTEQRLLRILVENRGNTMSRSLLIDKVWTDGAEYVDENALSVTVKRLRNKLEDEPSKPQYIKTVYGIGYTWQYENKNK